MDSNMTIEQRNAVSAKSQKLCEESARINLLAFEEIKNILKTCKDNRLGFTDDENDDNFIITMPDIDGTPTVYLVDEIKMTPGGEVWVVDETKQEWHIWEIGTPATIILDYIVEELQRELQETEC